MNSIVVSLGGLRAHYLGCYGGAWVETPTFDRFASEAFVFDECFVESPTPAATRQNWWTGGYCNFRNHDEPVSRDAGQPCLIRALRSAGIQTVLVRDSRAVAEYPSDDFAAFDQIMEINRGQEDSTARVFEAASQWMEREGNRDGSLLFVDCHGAHLPWYSPEALDDSDVKLEEMEAEQEDEEDIDDRVESDSSSPPLSSESDATARARQSYAAVVSHLDSELGSFLEFVDSRTEWEQSLVVITSDCGAALDNQPTTTLKWSFLHEGRMHVPLLIRMPAAHDPASRSAALVQSIDLMPTVCDVLGVAIPSDAPGRSLLPIVRSQSRSVRDKVLMADAGREWSIRTSAWRLMLSQAAAGSESPPEPQLFAKPYDRWDRNDVAKQYPDVVEHLERILRTRIR